MRNLINLLGRKFSLIGLSLLVSCDVQQNNEPIMKAEFASLQATQAEANEKQAYSPFHTPENTAKDSLNQTNSEYLNIDGVVKSEFYKESLPSIYCIAINTKLGMKSIQVIDSYPLFKENAVALMKGTMSNHPGEFVNIKLYNVPRSKLSNAVYIINVDNIEFR